MERGYIMHCTLINKLKITQTCFVECVVVLKWKYMLIKIVAYNQKIWYNKSHIQKADWKTDKGILYNTV